MRVRTHDASCAYAEQFFTSWDGAGRTDLALAYVAGAMAERAGKHLTCGSIEITVDRWVVVARTSVGQFYVRSTVVPLERGAAFTDSAADARVFGSLDDADRFCAASGMKGMGLGLDIVPA